MLTILHGEHTVKSREALRQHLAQAKAKNLQVVRLEAKSLTPAMLEEALVSQELFGGDKLVIIEELHSLPTSARKKTLIEMLATCSTDVVLWEKRSLTKTMLKPFAHAKVQEFKSSSSLFAWLDTLGDAKKTTNKKMSLLHEAFISDGDHFCFLMLIRQVRLLIQAKEGAVIAGPPFMQQKLRTQAAYFSLDALLKIHAQLLAIDERQKTSHNALNLMQELDLLTLRL